MNWQENSEASRIAAFNEAMRIVETMQAEVSELAYVVIDHHASEAKTLLLEAMQPYLSNGYDGAEGETIERVTAAIERIDRLIARLLPPLPF